MRKYILGSQRPRMFVNSDSSPIIQDQHSDSTVICCVRMEIVYTLRIVHACLTVLWEKKKNRIALSLEKLKRQSISLIWVIKSIPSSSFHHHITTLSNSTKANICYLLIGRVWIETLHLYLIVVSAWQSWYYYYYYYYVQAYLWKSEVRRDGIS